MTPRIDLLRGCQMKPGHLCPPSPVTRREAGVPKREELRGVGEGCVCVGEGGASTAV